MERAPRNHELGGFAANALLAIRAVDAAPAGAEFAVLVC